MHLSPRFSFLLQLPLKRFGCTSSCARQLQGVYGSAAGNRSQIMFVNIPVNKAYCPLASYSCVCTTLGHEILFMSIFESKIIRKTKELVTGMFVQKRSLRIIF